MNFILALLAGIGGAVAGFFAGVGIGNLLAPVFGITSFEGAAGYFVVLIGLLGGLIGLVAAIVLVLRYKAGHRGFRALAGRGTLVLGAIAALVAAGIAIRMATLEHFPGNVTPQLHFEIRLPAGMAEPVRRRVDFEMQAGSQRSGGQFKDEWLRRDGDRYVLSGFVPLYTRTAQRILVVSLPDQPRLLFSIGLSATPKTSDQYGAWQRVNFVDDQKPDSQPRRPGAAENFEIRFHVPKWQP
ncbi:MAG: hypothetical protein K8H87_14880 [Pseudorhodoplanes sp.]|nr:hypothetical protein [Pseudorhodoplanes sp.]